MIKEFCFSFEELNIITTDLTDLLGFEADSIPEPFPYLITQAIKDGTPLLQY